MAISLHTQALVACPAWAAGSYYCVAERLCDSRYTSIQEWAGTGTVPGGTGRGPVGAHCLCPDQSQPGRIAYALAVPAYPSIQKNNLTSFLMAENGPGQAECWLIIKY